MKIVLSRYCLSKCIIANALYFEALIILSLLLDETLIIKENKKKFTKMFSLFLVEIVKVVFSDFCRVKFVLLKNKKSESASQLP